MFVTFEGPEGAGKSTVVEAVAAELQSASKGLYVLDKTVLVVTNALRQRHRRARPHALAHHHAVRLKSHRGVALVR